jgi:hypothetical protein
MQRGVTIMRRIAFGALLAAAIVAVAVLTGAQGPGPGPGPADQPTVEQPTIHHPGPGERVPYGPPGGFHALRGAEAKLDQLDRAYAQELRQARAEIADLHRKLDENAQQLRALWEQAKAAETPEQREALRPEFQRLATERGQIELKIAERQAELAQKGFEIALERLVQAQVQLNETRIKVERRGRLLEGEWGQRPREGRPELLRELRERRLRQDQGPDEAPPETAPDEKSDSSRLQLPLEPCERGVRLLR